MMIFTQIGYFFYNTLYAMWKQYWTEIQVLFINNISHVIIYFWNAYAIFHTNSDFFLRKFCLVIFRYNLISVLCPYRSLFEKTNINFILENITQSYPVKIRATNIVNISILFCENWRLTLFKRWFKVELLLEKN